MMFFLPPACLLVFVLPSPPPPCRHPPCQKWPCLPPLNSSHMFNRRYIKEYSLQRGIWEESMSCSIGSAMLGTCMQKAAWGSVCAMSCSRHAEMMTGKGQHRHKVLFFSAVFLLPLPLSFCDGVLFVCIERGRYGL